MEMKSSIQTRNLFAFREATTIAKEIMRRNGQRRNAPSEVIERIASMKDESGRNVLHDAALLAVKVDDARYFNELVALGLPLYEEDNKGYFASFYIANIKGDGVFVEAFKALIKAGFDVSRPSTRHETFIMSTCSSDRITVQKMQALLGISPEITPEMVA